jgi:hypothetical protein
MDTASKRASAMLISLPFRPILPIPDGTVDSWDWPLLAHMYNGIGSSEGEVTGDGSSIGRLLRLYGR